jgi:ATP-dependent DNA helicase
MTASSSSVVVDDASSTHQADSSPASSPPAEASPSILDEPIVEKRLETEEEKARERNLLAERKRKASLRRRKKAISPAEREKKARELDDLLKQSTAFAEILTKKTEVLGRVGVSLDGKALGEHDLRMADQPKCLVGGTLRDYQLEGVTWMYEVCLQGMSGILADEMGLGMLSHSSYLEQELTSNRKNHPDDRYHRPPA